MTERNEEVEVLDLTQLKTPMLLDVGDEVVYLDHAWCNPSAPVELYDDEENEEEVY